MALSDFYKKINKVIYIREPDEYGDWNTRWELGEQFDGLVVLAGESVQNTEALRGNLAIQYRVSVPTSVDIKFGDKIAFDLMGDGTLEYAEITSSGVISPDQAITQMKLYTAQAWRFDDE